MLQYFRKFLYGLFFFSILGKGICDIIAAHKQIENQANHVVIEEHFVNMQEHA